MESVLSKDNVNNVLNLIINGLPSILMSSLKNIGSCIHCFKPYYKWITFNTEKKQKELQERENESFKPYYKWITFNTGDKLKARNLYAEAVLNLIINGLPSIQI